MKNKSKGLIITIVILIILLLASLGFIGYGYIKYNDINDKNEQLDKKYNELNSNYEKPNSKLEETNKNLDNINSNRQLNYVEYGYAEDTNIYAVYPSFIVYSIKDELYIAEDNSLSIPISNNIFYLDDLDFKNNVATINYDGIDDGNKVVNKITITKMNIKVSEVYKIIGKHATGFRDPTGEVFIIYKDGGLSHYLLPKQSKVDGKKVLTNYKIKNIETKCNDNECGSIKYKLTLQDGTTKEIDSLN